VQEEILANNPSADLRVYAVWFSMLPGDARSAWEDGVLADPRVVEFWDEERIVGEWFAGQVEGYHGIVWDAYYLYGPEARWDSAPSPLIGSGVPVYHVREALEAQILPLLR